MISGQGLNMHISIFRARVHPFWPQVWQEARSGLVSLKTQNGQRCGWVVWAMKMNVNLIKTYIKSSIYQYYINSCSKGNNQTIKNYTRWVWQGMLQLSQNLDASGSVGVEAALFPSKAQSEQFGSLAVISEIQCYFTWSTSKLRLDTIKLQQQVYGGTVHHLAHWHVKNAAQNAHSPASPELQVVVIYLQTRGQPQSCQNLRLSPGPELDSIDWSCSSTIYYGLVHDLMHPLERCNNSCATWIFIHCLCDATQNMKRLHSWLDLSIPSILKEGLSDPEGSTWRLSGLDRVRLAVSLKWFRVSCIPMGNPESISSRRLIQTISSNVGALEEPAITCINRYLSFRYKHGRHREKHRCEVGFFVWQTIFEQLRPAESPSSWTWTRKVGHSGGWNFEHPSLWIHFPTSLPKASNSDSIDCEHAGTAVAWKLAWLYAFNLHCFAQLCSVFQDFQSWKIGLVFEDCTCLCFPCICQTCLCFFPERT